MRAFDEQFYKGENFQELQKIVSLIVKFVDPLYVILLNQYEGINILTSAEGYDLMILTNGKRKYSPLQLRKFVINNIPTCRVDHLNFFPVALKVFNAEFFHNYFFYKVIQEGVLLYQNNTEEYPLVKEKSFKPTKALKRVIAENKRFQELGRCFLEDAEKHYTQQEMRIGMFDTVQAVRQFLLQGMRVFFGFEQNDKTRLLALYRPLKRTNELKELWEVDTKKPEVFLADLEKQNTASRFQTKYSVRLKVFKCYLRKTKELQVLVDRLYNERVEILQEMIRLKYSKKKKTEEIE